MGVPTHSALIVTVPEADPVVGPHRDRFDRAAAWGVPAHVTVLHPFLPPDRLTDDVVRRVADAVATVATFTAEFRRTGWFGEDVLYLQPTASRSFTALTDAVVTAFPEHQPYGGAHDDVVPHLTIAHDAPLEVMREAERDVRARLPLTVHVTEVGWWRGREAARSWEEFARLALRAGA